MGLGPVLCGEDQVKRVGTPTVLQLKGPALEESL